MQRPRATLLQRRGSDWPLLRFPQHAVVLGHFVFVALGDFFAAGAADAPAGVGLIHLAAQFHFHLLHAAQRGLNTLNEDRIVGKHRRIELERVELAQVAHRILDVAGGIGIVAQLLLQLLQALDGVAIALLEIPRVYRTAIPIAAPVSAVIGVAVAAPGAAVRTCPGTAALLAAALRTALLLAPLLLATSLLPALLLPASLLPALLLAALLLPALLLSALLLAALLLSPLLLAALLLAALLLAVARQIACPCLPGPAVLVLLV